jgi:hypothetical protein
MDAKITVGKPETFGWQRRPDLDTPAGLAYEAPDGTLKLFPKDKTPELARTRLPSLNELDEEGDR